MNKNIERLGFFPLLGLLFIALKLTDVVAWPWIWVLAPIWLPVAFAFTIFAVVSILIVLFDR